MPEIMIFKAGKYAQGEWPKERVQKMVDAYDPEKNIEAPVVIGHRWYGESDEHEFAHGWVKGLRMDGAGKVYADIEFTTAKVLHALAEKQLKYVSAEIYELDRRDEKEAPYLRAVALLGRNPPAVQGTKLPALFEMFKGGGLTADEKTGIAEFTRKMDAEECRVIKGEHTLKKEEPRMDEEQLKAELAAKEAEATAFKKELEELKSAGKKQDAEAYFGKLRDEGRLPPALFEKAVSLDIRLDAEGRKELRALVSEFEKTVDLSGAHVADKKTAAPAGEGIVAKVKAYQKEKGFMSFEDAANALFATRPDLFEGGEA
jgi:hypothetical protein